VLLSSLLIVLLSRTPQGFASQEQFLVAETTYTKTCASCHGINGEGRDEIPSLNGSGHAWHHTDQQVAKWIKEGIGTMPAVAPHWSDETIQEVHSYIKLWWTEEQRDWQARATKQSMD